MDRTKLDASARLFFSRMSRWCAHLVFAVILAAGGIKALDLSAFAAGLELWSLIPKRLLPVLTFCIPLIEIVTGGLWFLTSHKWLAVPIATVLLAVFTAALLTHWAFAGAPRCNCFGRLQMFRASRHEALWSTARNLVLLGLLSPSLFGRTGVLRHTGSHGP